MSYLVSSVTLLVVFVRVTGSGSRERPDPPTQLQNARFESTVLHEGWTVHGEEAVTRLSAYHIAIEVHGTHQEMTIILDHNFWRKQCSRLTPLQMAREFKRLASNMKLNKCRNAKWKPKQKPTAQVNTTQRGHVSTARVPQESRGTSRATR